MSPDEEHPATPSDDALLGACDVERTRASGPGGQHRNKVETAIRLHHLASGVVVNASERRSQHENLRVALRRLRLALAVQVRATPPIDGVSELWLSRRKGTRIACGAEHVDLAPLVAEALDAVAASDWEPRPAAEWLGVSSSQLVKLVGTHPPALAEWNARRREAGRAPLR